MNGNWLSPFSTCVAIFHLPCLRLSWNSARVSLMQARRICPTNFVIYYKEWTKLHKNLAEWRHSYLMEMARHCTAGHCRASLRPSSTVLTKAGHSLIYPMLHISWTLALLRVSKLPTWQPMSVAYTTRAIFLKDYHKVIATFLLSTDTMASLELRLLI